LRPWVAKWISAHGENEVAVIDRLAAANGGDALVLLACHEIAAPAVRERYDRTYVTHASDLPQGRGWSPLVWGVLQGRSEIVLSLMEAADPVDSGRIYQKFRCPIEKTDLWDELNSKLAKLTLEALDFLVSHPSAEPIPQSGEPTWLRRRGPEDSRLDPDASIASQFDLLRVCDPQRFPAFFDLFGERFEIILRKKAGCAK
jgi:methionyl-tRNA formyltransferase